MSRRVRRAGGLDAESAERVDVVLRAMRATARSPPTPTTPRPRRPCASRARPSASSAPSQTWRGSALLTKGGGPKDGIERTDQAVPRGTRLGRSHVGRDRADGSGGPTWDEARAVPRGTGPSGRIRRSHVGRGSGGPTWDGIERTDQAVPRGTRLGRSHVGRGSGGPAPPETTGARRAGACATTSRSARCRRPLGEDADATRGHLPIRGSAAARGPCRGGSACPRASPRWPRRAPSDPRRPARSRATARRRRGAASFLRDARRVAVTTSHGRQP